jgi:hypothetical protein
MRLGLAVVSVAAVIGGYALVNTLGSRPAAPADAKTAAETGRSWAPRAIDEPDSETRTYELIRYLNPDGSLGMVDDPRRVPPGARILGRERKTAAAAKRAPAAPEPGHRLTPAEQRVMERVLETGVSPDAHQLEQMQGDLDALDRERAAAGVDAEGRAARPR